MRHELTIRSSDRGLNEIILNVPRGHRGEGLDMLDRAMPAIRELERLTRAVAVDQPESSGQEGDRR